MDKNNAKTYLQQWEAIVNADSQKEALIKHFAYLADSPNYKKLLEAIMEEIEEVSITNDSLQICFRDNDVTLNADAPENEVPENFPQSFKDKLKHHKFLSINDHQIVLGDQALFCESDGWFEEMYEWRNICDLNDVINPLGVDADLWLYHPTETNTTGEPMLYYKAHDGGDVENPRDINVGSLFLEQLAWALDIDLMDVLNPVSEEELTAWWQSLDDEWKRFFLTESNIDKPNSAYIKNLWKETAFYLGKDSGITTLAPLRAFKELDRLQLDSLNIADYSPINDIATLRSLSIVNMPFNDFDGFGHLTRLGALDLSNTGFSDLRKLKPLKKLYSLILNNNPIESLEGIEQFRELVRLEIDDTKVTAIAPLKSLKKLNYLHICRLELSDYTLLATMDGLLTIEIDTTPLGDFKALDLDISLKKYLRFLGKINNTNDQRILFPTGKDALCSAEEFIAHLQAINFPTKEYADTICLFANRFLLNTIKEKNKVLGHRLISEIMKLALKTSKEIHELWMSNVIIALCMNYVDSDEEQEILKRLNASKIAAHGLAFNLACFYALRSKKPEMLKTIKKALSLGRAKGDFMKDADFKAYYNDPDFIKVLN